jgi:hypothetical protein
VPGWSSNLLLFSFFTLVEVPFIILRRKNHLWSPVRTHPCEKAS